jgi:hypothetical protein
MGINSTLGSSALLPAGLGFRNVLINGGFDVWQRGTSFTGAANTVSYTADRWCIFRSGVAGYSLSQQAMVPSELSGFNYCARFQRTSGNADLGILYMGRTFESITVKALAGKTVTLSFYARKGANFSGSILDAQIEFGTGTDLGFTTQPTSASINNLSSTLTASWQYFVKTVVVPTTATAARILFMHTPTGTAGANDYFEITGVQLEQNYQPTPFEQRPIGIELELCQRYYWKNEIYGSGATGGSGAVPIVTIAFKTKMRTSPTITYISGGTTMNGLADLTIGSLYSGLPVRDLSADGAELLFSLASGSQTNGGPVTVKGAIMQATAEL